MLVIEQGTPGDLQAVLELEHASQSHPWPSAGFGAALAARDGERAVLLCEYRPLGLLVERRLVAYCVLRLAAGELEIHNVAVAPEARRRGLARRLLGWVLDRAGRDGAERALLEVRTGNVAARALYQGLGFREVGRRPGYYSQPAEDALVLARELQAAPGGAAGQVPAAATGLP